jgi:phage shock protein C
MYCSQCGKQMEAGARFCPSCGAMAQPAVYGRAPYPGQLTRPRHPRVIAGVCSGLALHYGWDPALVRLVCVLLFLVGGGGFIAYIIAWIVIPEEPYALPAVSSTNYPGSGV